MSKANREQCNYRLTNVIFSRRVLEAQHPRVSMGAQGHPVHVEDTATDNEAVEGIGKIVAVGKLE